MSRHLADHPLRSRLPAQIAGPGNPKALRFDELQAPMALFAEAFHGSFVRLDLVAAQELAADKSGVASPWVKNPWADKRPTRIPEAPRVILPETYDRFDTRAHNLGACRVDILRQLIMLSGDSPDSSPRPDALRWGVFLTRLLAALQALCRDMMLRRDFPGARADLERVLLQARRDYAPQSLDDVGALQNHILQVIEEMALGIMPAASGIGQNRNNGSTSLDSGPQVQPGSQQAEAPEASEAALRSRVFRLAQTCAQAGAKLPDCLPCAILICRLLGVPVPAELMSVQALSLADTGLEQVKSPGDQTRAQAGEDKEGGGQTLDDYPSGADGGEMSQKHGQQGASTAQVPDFFELKPTDLMEPLPSASDAAQAPRLTVRPESRIARSILYPEWHYQERRYWPAWCRVHEHRLRGDNSHFIRDVRQRYGALAREVRERLAAIRPNHLQRVARNLDGEEADLEAVINMVTDRRAGRFMDDRLYVQRQRVRREVSAAFLVDMSGSTNISMPGKAEAKRRAETPETEDSPYLYGGGMFAANDTKAPMRRVIDVAKDALALMCDGLQGLGDRFAVYGFSGDGRKQVDFYIAKDFEDALSGRTWAALAAIEPKRSSRLGPAIRHAVHKFRGQSDVRRLLIIISDGYPQDSDYGPDPDEVEYGIQDSGRAMAEAERAGIQPFFITIDPAGQDYMGRICSEHNSMLIDDIDELPLALSKVYGGLRRR